MASEEKKPARNHQSKPSKSSFEEEEQIRFSPEEERDLLAESQTHKVKATAHFSASKYNDAITEYNAALQICPQYLLYESAVLHSNIAACHIKLADWKAAADSASEALDGLEKLDPLPKPASKDDNLDERATAATDGSQFKAKTKEADARVVEVSEDEPDKAEASESRRQEASGDTLMSAHQTTSKSESSSTTQELKHSIDDVRRIRVKSLMRRGKARSEQGGWANLQGALEDFTLLSKSPSLSPADGKIVRAALQQLPPRVEAARSAEMGEMMGKLKQLGNGILKPFGLSTDNFNMVKDEKSGGYSMQFNQGGK